MYCSYYQARFVKETTWFVVGCLKAESNLVFERATDDDRQLFEFFVTPSCEPEFVSFMACMEGWGYVSDLVKLPNRLQR